VSIHLSSLAVSSCAINNRSSEKRDKNQDGGLRVSEDPNGTGTPKKKKKQNSPLITIGHFRILAGRMVASPPSISC